MGFQVVVDESARGTGLGKYLVTVCTRLSQHLGVYKVNKRSLLDHFNDY